MTYTCKVCNKRAYSEYCAAHKPRKPILSRSKPLKASKTVSKPSKPKKPLKKPVKRSKVVKDLDNIYSQYIRLKYADNNGMVECYTCGSKMHWKEAQHGHFFTRARYSTRWDDDNSRVQDYRCNVALGGNYIIYTRKMLAELGEKRFNALELKSNTLIKVPTSELIEKIAYYKTEVERLKSEKGIA